VIVCTNEKGENGKEDMKVLMVQRRKAARFMSSYHVFPGLLFYPYLIFLSLFVNVWTPFSSLFLSPSKLDLKRILAFFQ
jgi:hypothetical protein